MEAPIAQRRAAGLTLKAGRVLLVGGLILMLFVQVRTFWPATIDDAFITFRYSEHWAHGLGLTFNPGDRVEGFSNFLWVAILAAASAVHLDTVLVAKLLGLGALLFVTVLAVRALFAVVPARFFLGAALAGLLISNCFFVFFAATGMETICFAALLMLVLDRLRVAGNRMTWSAATALLLLALTRPEGILYAIVLAPVLAWLGRGSARRPWSWSWVLLIGGYAVFLAWRWHFFGTLWPNTFYAKPTAGSGFGVAGLLAGQWLTLPECARWLMAAGGPLALALAAYGALSAKSRQMMLPMGAALVAGLAFQAYAGPDWMEIARFLMPVWAPLVVLAVIGWCQLELSVRAGWRDGALALWVGCALLFNLQAGAEFWKARHAYPGFVMTSEDMIAAARWMGERYPANYSVVCWRIGALGYYSKLTVIDDEWGLTDRYIAELKARRALTDEARDAYLAQRNPELVIKRGLSDAAPPGSVKVGGREYTFVRRFAQGSDEWWDLYERSDISM